MENFKKNRIEKERAKSDHERWVNFEHELRYLLCELKDNTDREDDFLLDDIKQAVIVFGMKDKFEETNEIFLSNIKNDFYSALQKLDNKHADLQSHTFIIRLFMEDFYFNKA